MNDHEPEVVIEDPRLEAKGLMYEHLEYSDAPQFRISEVCKVFFGKTDHWFRWLQRETDTKPNYLIWNGKEVGVRKNERGMRSFGLRDVEEVAYALADNKRIDGTQLKQTLLALDTIGRIWGVRYERVLTRRGQKAPVEEPEQTQEQPVETEETPA